MLTVGVVTGFQHEIREKVSGFGSHILITNAGEQTIYESAPIHKDLSLLTHISNDKDVYSIGSVAYKPVLLQSDKIIRNITLHNGKDSSYLEREIQGALLKGVDNNYNLAFFKQYLIKGRMPQFHNDKSCNEIIVSEQIASDLKLKLNSDVNAFFVKNKPVKRQFRLVGVYNTGLEDFDKKIILGDLRIVQELNDWGIKASINVADTMYQKKLIIQAEVKGGNGDYYYDWGKGFNSYAGFTYLPKKDTCIRLIVKENNGKFNHSANSPAIDTAYLLVHVVGNESNPGSFLTNNEQQVVKEYLNEDGSKFNLKSHTQKVVFEQISGKGTVNQFISGYEINLKNWNNIAEKLKKLKRKIEFTPTQYGEFLSVKGIVDTQPDIFVWLGFLDINVVIILSLMILIGIINMGSTLLVMILVRTNFIGILKSIGASDWSIRKIFLFKATFLILRGMIYGNIIGVCLCGIQYLFGIVKLDPNVYYLSKVPMELTFFNWLSLNVTTLVICLISMALPSIIITRISPVKAIRFE